MPSKRTIDRIKNIQKRLGLTADGIIGPATLTAFENVIDQALGPDGTSTHILKITKRGLDRIVDFEISSVAYYNLRLKSPYFPGGKSGVTIGVGYDLGHQSPTQIEKDWKGKIDDVELAQLQAVSGLTGTRAKAQINSLKNISIPIGIAKEVFFTSAIPNYAKRTAKAFPGILDLPADAQSMLLSLVFNRGSSMANTDRRKEMRNIRDLVPGGDLEAIADEVRSMKRFWIDANLSGLLKRRDKEAQMIENPRPDNSLPPGEMILV